MNAFYAVFGSLVGFALTLYGFDKGCTPAAIGGIIILVSIVLAMLTERK